MPHYVRIPALMLLMWYIRTYIRVLRYEGPDNRQHACGIFTHRPIKNGYCQTCGVDTRPVLR